MRRRFLKRSSGLTLVLALTLAGGHAPVVAATTAPATTTSQAAGLKIVVLAGEDAVNIIQQKTAVAPVVEVRDRNDEPVAGAVVVFAIRGGKATFNGARTQTVTTNGVGRAAVTGLTPIASGALQISVTAAFQGQTVAATIAQTNVLTPAQAAAAAGSGAAGAGAAGVASAAAGGSAAGGGLSGVAIGAIAAGVGGGVLVAANAAAGSSSDPAPASAPKSVVYTGTFATQFILVTDGSNNQGPYGCQSTRAVNGTVTMELLEGNGAVTGTASVTASEAQIALTGSPGLCGGSVGTTGWGFKAAVTGTPANLAFSQQVASGGNNAGVVTNQTQTVAFTGALAGGGVTGPMSYGVVLVGQGVSHSWTEKASMTVPLTLR